MATYDKGRLKGKLGDQIFYTRNGKTYVRNAPLKKKARKLSPEEKARCARLPFVVRFLTPLSEVIARGFNISGENTNFNKATSYNYQFALSGEYPDLRIDYPAVRITAGRIPGLQSTAIERNSKRNLKVTWSKTPQDLSHADGLVYLAGLHESYSQIILNDDEVYRDDCELSIQLPDDYPAEGRVHFYLFCCDKEGEEYSNSQYAGGLEL